MEDHRQISITLEKWFLALLPFHFEEHPLKSIGCNHHHKLYVHKYFSHLFNPSLRPLRRQQILIHLQVKHMHHPITALI